MSVAGDIIVAQECRERMEIARRLVAAHPEREASPQTALADVLLYLACSGINHASACEDAIEELALDYGIPDPREADR